MNTFSSAGDLGDVIYSLPTVRALGGGVLYLSAANHTRMKMTPERAASMATLLRLQPYIAGCTFHDGQPVLYDLDQFRTRFRAWNFSETLVESHCRHFKVDPSVADEPWLTCPKEEGRAKVVFNLTGRYRNRSFDWRTAYLKYRSDAIFVGNDVEAQDFCCQVGPIEHFKTPTVLDLAVAINSSTLFLGNQSLPLAICHGLAKSVVHECSSRDYNGFNSKQPNVWRSWGSYTVLPDLKELP